MGDWIKDYYAAVDAMRAEDAASFFTEDAQLRFGNADPIVGRQNIRDALVEFNSSVKGLQHEIKAQWKEEDVEIAELEVTYTRHDESTVTLPSTTIFRREGNLARDVRIYMDMTPVFE